MLQRPPTGTIPDAPGSYQFRDSDGRIIYVGKAKSLRSRLSNYFQNPQNLPPRTAQMVASAASVEWIQVRNDVEALMLEYSLIKQHKPRFNVRLRDDKSYPFLAITLSDEWPRAMVRRGARDKGSRHFGPYAHAYAIRETLDSLLRTFPIRTCSDNKFHTHQRLGRPCLLFHIEKCSGPCIGAIDHEPYRVLLDELIAFLDGDTTPVVNRLESEMAAAAGNLEYERAARLRDRVTAVRKVAEKQQMVTESAEDLDCFGMVEDELEAAIQVFYVRRGRVVGRKGLVVDKVEDLSRPQLLADILEQHYAEAPLGIPPLILVPEAPDDEDTLSKWLASQRTVETSPETTGPQTTGPQTTGPETTGPETTGPGMTGPETTAPQRTGTASPELPGATPESPPGQGPLEPPVSATGSTVALRSWHEAGIDDPAAGVQHPDEAEPAPGDPATRVGHPDGPEPAPADPAAQVEHLDVPEPAPEALARVLAAQRPHRSAVGDVEWWAASDRYRVERSVNPAARRGAHVEIRVPQRGEKKALLETVTRNAGEEFTRHRLKRAADHNARARALNALQDALDLPESPLRIECYDMSHLQGTDYVGSMVVMEDGMPRPSEYRRFKIKTIDQNDDYAAMGEVLSRRLNAYLVEREKPVGDRQRRFAYPPQLLLVDGGKGQLGVAVQVLEELGLDEEIPVASLAKQFEEVFVPGRPDPVRIPRSSEALYLLQQIRDEAHRFAITYHRQLRGKRMTTSVLDGVPGLGPARKKRLTKELGGVSGVRAASLETLTGLAWLPDSVATAVHRKLHEPV